MKKKFIYLLTFLLLFIFIIQTTFVYGTNDNSDDLNIYSDAAILIDSKTGTILYSKASEEEMYPASTTKILTAILALEKCNLDDIVTVSKSAISSIPSGYSSAYLSEGEKISVNDLITVFLVHSANDAGYVLAEHISGSIEEFAKLMNEKALEIGCKHTHFTNPSGIHNENHYTTAYDLALIARYCMQNSKFRNIVSMKTCTINATNKFGIRKYTNTNDLINPSSKYYLEECVGIKTGYTAQAKNCLISACAKNNLGLICVVLGANQLHSGESSRYEDSINLFKYGYSNYSIKTFANKDDIIKNIEVKNGTKKTRNLDLTLEDSISGLVKNNENLPNASIVLNDTISAPISKGTILGTISYTVGNNTYTKNLVASHDVEEDKLLLFIFEIILGIVLLLILTTILISKSKKKRKKKKYYYGGI
mgnify:FL=1